MASKSNQIYTIKLADWVLADPSFSKKTSTYLPISRAFLNQKSTEFLSAGEFKLMISFIEVACNLGRSTIEVNTKFYRSQGKALEKSLLKLSNYEYLDILINELIKEGRKYSYPIKHNQDSSESLPHPIGLLSSRPQKKGLSENFAHDQIAHVWSYYCEAQGLSKVIHWTKKRNTMAKNISAKFTKEQLELAAQKIASSNFCRGENDRGWKANIDFFLNEQKIVKVLEGAYDNKPQSSSGQSTKFVLEE